MIDSAVDGDVRILTIERPTRQNALTRDHLDSIQDALDTAAEPVVYLQGSGQAFCAGADLGTVTSLDQEAAIEFAKHGQAVANAIEEYDGVVVAGIDGPARGGGVELALACDIRLGTPDATLAETGVTLGLFGAWGGTVRLPQIVGQGQALELALSGRVLSAQEARNMGLLSRIVEQPRSVVTELAENDPVAMWIIKERIRDRSAPDRQEKREAESFGELIDRLDASDIDF